jgi:glycosyltransferase involved in cell wall biosynthesis
MENKPLVSVCMITYNHERYIAEAIEGVLKQETNFPIELVIGEDCSTDNTRKICAEYAKKYPGIIRLLEREKNLGMIPNFADTLKHCKGKYVALCEGDDYWTDSHKLQIQVDFMEANPDFAICHHSSLVIYENGEKEPHLMNTVQKEVMTFEDFIACHGNCIRTESCLFRNHLFGDYPKWALDLNLGDWVLHLLNAQYGKIKFIDRTMSVYRIHPGGVWSSKKSVKNVMDFAEAVAKCKYHFAPRSESQFNSFLAFMYADVCFFYFQDGEHSKFLESLESYKNYWCYLPQNTLDALMRRKALALKPVLAKFYNFFITKVLKKDFRHPELGRIEREGVISEIN